MQFCSYSVHVYSCTCMACINLCYKSCIMVHLGDGEFEAGDIIADL